MCFVQPQPWDIFSMASGSVKSKTRGGGVVKPGKSLSTILLYHFGKVFNGENLR